MLAFMLARDFFNPSNNNSFELLENITPRKGEKTEIKNYKQQHKYFLI
jgi:hypothetical protein